MTQPTDQPSPGSAPRRVVIAEDEVLIRMDLAEMLSEEGYDVVGQAGDGAKAIELAEALRPDLVILDVKMPVLDGIAAAERIATQRIAPVVILTAFSQRDLVERAKNVLQRDLGLTEPEAFRWIQKTAMDLRLSMRQVADGVITHGPGIAGG